jgi:putative endonuclease
VESSGTVSTWWVYLLRCSDRTLYTGITTDLEGRLRAHRDGTASKYTRVRLPVRLVYQEPHSSRSSASKREAAIKKLSRPAKLALIRRR